MSFSTVQFKEKMKRCMDHYNVVAQNLANSDTGGFRKQLVYERNQQLSSVTDTTRGALQNTNNPLNLAIEGNGFFAIQTPQGIKFTRYGQFLLNDKKQLINSSGFPVLGEKGVITLTGKHFEINDKGQVLSDGQVVDTLAVREAVDTLQITPAGQGLVTFQPANVTDPNANRILRGQLESSNVNMLQEMTSSIEILREFQITQKLLQITQGMEQKCASDMGRTV